MTSIGLIVEGDYDEAALTEFVRKCLSTEVNVICRPCGGAPQLMKKFPGFLDYFRRVNAGFPVDRAIVVRDADHKNSEALISQMESKISGRTYLFPRYLLVAVETMEAWLLADEQALSAVTNQALHRVPEPEKIFDPKARLRTILSRAQIVYTPEMGRKIAAAARPDILAARCPSFKKFQEALANG
jgi:hypothetical protein